MRRLFAFFDPLPLRAPFVVEPHHGATGQMEIRHDETDARKHLVGMVLDCPYSLSAKWIKIRNPDYTQAEDRQEMFESFREKFTD